MNKLNENVKALADQAEITIDGMGYGEGNVEKFAKLIIAECLSFIQPMPDSGDIDDIALEHCYADIKSHFGV